MSLQIETDHRADKLRITARLQEKLGREVEKHFGMRRPELPQPGNMDRHPRFLEAFQKKLDEALVSLAAFGKGKACHRKVEGTGSCYKIVVSGSFFQVAFWRGLFNASGPMKRLATQIRVGLYGINGHQSQSGLASHPRTRLVAIAGIPREELPPALRGEAALRVHGTFEELLADPEVDFVSLCSPRRADQAGDAIRALRAGKHVLAEKPSASTEEELDAILAAAAETGRAFHEMADTAFWQPYYAMREIVKSGRLGEIVQVVAEKSYPCHDKRPQDEAVDGGLIAQNAIHALRFVEHVAGTPIASIRAVETSLGNPVAGGGLRMAASMMLTLKNGGVASIAANYLNPGGTGIWGDESLKILGTRGLVESRAGGKWTRLVIGDKDLGPLDGSGPAISWLDAVLESLPELGPGRKAMPLTLEEELSPLRWALRANRSAKSVD